MAGLKESFLARTYVTVIFVLIPPSKAFSNIPVDISVSFLPRMVIMTRLNSREGEKFTKAMDLR